MFRFLVGVLVLVLAVWWNSSEDAMSFRVRQVGSGRSCVILGATGATGLQVLEQVVSRDNWSKVVLVGRREPNSAAAKDAKVSSIVIPDMNNLDQNELTEKLKGIDVFFNCIGTTRGQAGSADAFHAIEVGISEKVANAAAAAGVSHGSVISAQGADPDRQFAPKWFHPLFYGKTIGLKEKAMTDAGFKKTTIFRPGMLQRHDETRTSEKIFASILPSLDVRLLAAAMVNDAESASAETKEAPLYISGNSVITKLANQKP